MMEDSHHSGPAIFFLGNPLGPVRLPSKITQSFFFVFNFFNKYDAGTPTSGAWFTTLLLENVKEFHDPIHAPDRALAEKWKSSVLAARLLS